MVLAMVRCPFECPHLPAFRTFYEHLKLDAEVWDDLQGDFSSLFHVLFLRNATSLARVDLSLALCVYRLLFSPSRKLRYRNAPVRSIHLFIFMAIYAHTIPLVKCLCPAKLIVPLGWCLQATEFVSSIDMCLNEVTQLPWHPSMRTMPKIQSWIYECDDKKCLEFLWWNPSPSYAEMSEEQSETLTTFVPTLSNILLHRRNSNIFYTLKMLRLHLLKKIPKWNGKVWM